MIPSSELIINPSGTIYHLDLHSDQIADTIITVGDPERVESVAARLDAIEHTVQRREFKTVTGRIGSKSITIISTGIGTDNIDIVFSELDALANIDFSTREAKLETKSLNLIRLGTSGTIRPEIAIDSIVLSKYAIGLDGLMHYYKTVPSIAEDVIQESALYQLRENLSNIVPYVSSADLGLLSNFTHLGVEGITITATGFYGPQGRKLRKEIKDADFIDNLSKIVYKKYYTTNLEMETAGIYGMSSILGHKAVSINAILANRVHKTFSTDPSKAVNVLIDKAMPIIASL
jgi:uridine phosphorylase